MRLRLDAIDLDDITGKMPPRRPHFDEAVTWQRMSRESHIRATLFPSDARQRQAAHFSHMARRALFTLINGAKA